MAVKKKKTQSLKIRYNAPVTLTFSFIAFLVLILNQTLLHGLTQFLFAVPGRLNFLWTNPFNYLRLFTHVFGHAGWDHLIGNLSFILLLGPLLEQRYGSAMLLLMIFVTAFVTGVLNICFFTTGLLGASGIAFMMILLASFTNIEKNEIPLTFILIVLLFMGREVAGIFARNDIAEFAHLVGGICGSLFGFLTPEPGKRNPPRPEREASPGRGTVGPVRNAKQQTTGENDGRESFTK
jgi:membrane associated rhomboid family serine protease